MAHVHIKLLIQGLDLRGFINQFIDLYLIFLHNIK